MLTRMMILMIIVLMNLITPTNIWAKDSVIYKDVTGDGKLEKIYVEPLCHGAGTVHFRLVIKEKISHGWKEIFPMYYHCYNQLSTNKALEGTVFSINSDGDFGGYIIGKFTSKYPGQQILIYFPCTTPEERKITYFEGFFFKKELKDKEYTIYRKDVTDRKYKNSPNLHQQLKKEFQKQTRFTKAYQVVCDFWQALKKQEDNRIDRFLYCEPLINYHTSHNYPPMLLDSVRICQKESLLLQAKDFNFHSFNGKFCMISSIDGVIRKHYLFEGSNKKYAISILVESKSLKITNIGGDKDGEPFIGC